MQRRIILLGMLLCVTVAIILWLGVGPYSSGSAVADLRAEMESLHGPENDDMVFVVEPRTWFLTNWNLRNALGMDYEYECKVIFPDETVTYRGIDPMGTEELDRRAYLDIH